MSDFPREHPPSNSGANEGVAGKESGFHFPLGFDPMRWVYALLKRAYWPIGMAALLGISGFLVGTLSKRESYSASLQLIKKPVPSVIKAGEQGDAFRPRQLNDRSLRSTLLANEAIYKTATSLGIDPEALKDSVEIEQLEGTDFFYITVHMNADAEHALKTVELWADEIIHYTIGLQRRESLAMRALLEDESNDLARELEGINQQLLNFSSDNDFLDGDKQLEASLRSLAAMELQLEDARIMQTSKQEQVKALTAELQELSPVSDQLKSAGEELAQLRGRYTDSNPLVKEKLYEIEYLEGKLKEEKANPGDDLRRFTGTPLGNQLYLEIVQARNELLQLEQRTREYTRLLEEQRARLQHLPRQILRYSELLQNRDQVRRAYDLLNSRLQEARIFAESAPGYWEVFQSPTLGDVHLVVDQKLALLLGGAGFSGGLFLGLILSLFLEWKTPTPPFPLAYAIATKSLPDLELPAGDHAAWRAHLNAFWLTDLIRLQRDGYLVIVTSHAALETERTFWSKLFDLAEMDETPLRVLDLSQQPRDLGATGDQYTHWRSLDDWRSWARENLTHGPVILRLHGDPYPAIIPVLEEVGHWLCLVDESHSLSEIKQSLRLYTHSLQFPDGLILVRRSAQKPLAKLCEQAGLLLGSLLRKKPSNRSI